MEFKVFLELLVHQVLLEEMAHKVSKVFKVYKVYKVYKVLQDQPVQQDPQVQMELAVLVVAENSASTSVPMRMALFAVLGLLELWPMVTFIRWRIDMKRGLTPDTRAFLIDGTLDAVLTQSPAAVITNCVRIFANLRDKRAPLAGVEPVRMSIVFRENLP